MSSRDRAVLRRDGRGGTHGGAHCACKMLRFVCLRMYTVVSVEFLRHWMACPMYTWVCTSVADLF